jgi:hypothetical protein
MENGEMDARLTPLQGEALAFNSLWRSLPWEKKKGQTLRPAPSFENEG